MHSYIFHMNALVIILFFLGFILILKAGDLLVESSVWIAEITKIPSMIIGATVVSIATTFPETTVAVMASLSSQEELALNTSIGSIICNFTLVLGIAFSVLPCKMDGKAFSSKSRYFLFLLIILSVFCLGDVINFIEGILLLIMFIVFLIINVNEAKHSKIITIENNTIRPPVWYIFIQFIISAACIGYGASVLVQNTKAISEIIGLSEDFVGLFLIALGTNIPEIVTAITAVRKKTPEIGVGNIFGASIINGTMLIGIASILAPDKNITINNFMRFVSMPIMFFTLIVVSLPIKKHGKSSRLQGVFLLLIYVIYSILMAIFV